MELGKLETALRGATPQGSGGAAAALSLNQDVISGLPEELATAVRSLLARLPARAQSSKDESSEATPWW